MCPSAYVLRSSSLHLRTFELLLVAVLIFRKPVSKKLDLT